MLALGGAAILAAGAVMRWYPWWGGALGVLAVALAWFSLRDRLAFLASASALLALGFYAFSASAPPVDDSLPRDVARRFTGIVAEDPVMTGSGWRMAVDLSGVATEEPTEGWTPVGGRVLLAVEGWPDPPPAEGDAAVFRATLREPLGFVNPGGLGREVSAVRRGIVARGFAKAGSTVLFARPASGEAPLGEFRREVSESIALAAPGRAGGALRSLAVGDRSGVDRETFELFRRTGTVHLLSVSGLHMAVVLLLFASLARALLVRIPRLALLAPVDPVAKAAALVPVATYAVLCGFSPATARALAMTALLCGALAMSRRVSVLSSLSSTLLLLLLVNPLSITDPGLQLSFVAVAGLFFLPGLLGPEGKEKEKPLAPPTRWEKTVRRFGAWGGSLLLASLAATLATAPLASFHFGQGGWSGVLHNLLAVPVSGFVTLPLALAGVAAHPAVPWLSVALWKVAALSLDALFAAMEAMPALEGKALGHAFATATGLFGAYAVLAALAIKGRKFKARVAAAAAGVALMLANPAWAAVARWADGDARLYVFDVGSGQALALDLPGGGWIAIDGGGVPGSELDTGADVVWPSLNHLGCTRLEVVVSSHPHPDHLGGLPSLVRLGRPAEVWLPQGFAGDARYGRLTDAAAEVGAKVVWIGEEFRRKMGAATFRLIEGSGKSENDRSFVIEVESGGARAVIPNDVEAVEQARLVGATGFFRKAELFVAPHHGWGNGVSREVWSSVRPSAALVSCGERKNLPSRPFLEEAARIGARVYSTAASGALAASFGADGCRAGPAPR